MILRKPYAFFIKHFKLIHIILTLLTCYSIYKTKILLDFFTDYSATFINVIGQDLNVMLISSFYIIIPILIIILSIIVLVVLTIKKKPNFFYLLNITIFIYTFVIILVANSTLITMSNELISVKISRLVRDLMTISFFAQIFSVVILIVRSSGFDIKKFDFQKDLDNLDISEEDREEFEVEFSLDKNVLKRKIRKRIRFFKYAYKENKLLFLVVSGLILITIITIPILSINKEKKFSENDYILANGISLKIKNSYLVNHDYRGNIIDDDYYYLILQISVKNNLSNDNKIEKSVAKIIIDNYVYTPITGYGTKFIDFGYNYQGENLNNNYEDKILVYQIPKELKDRKMTFSFINKNTLNIGYVTSNNVTLKLQRLNQETTNGKVVTGQTLKLDNSILSDYEITINEAIFSKQFKIDYSKKINNVNYQFSEYVKPKLNTNYDKVLLKIKGSINKKDIPEIYNLYDFIYNFATLNYVIDGKTYSQNVRFSEVKSTQTKESDTYYIEVYEDVIESTSAWLTFKIRDKKYEYILK